MSRLALLRHAPTAWNREGKLQGRMDVSLGVSGVNEAKSWILPEEIMSYSLYSSPLSRAVSTARAVTDREPVVDARLIEMDWGDWEGMPLDELRENYGDGVPRDGKAGLDFCAPSGESPRMVQQRILPFLVEIAKSGHDALAITHKGVIRAVYALATGWDMLTKPDNKIGNGLHIFDLSPDGMPSVAVLNVELGPEQ